MDAPQAGAKPKWRFRKEVRQFYQRLEAAGGEIRYPRGNGHPKLFYEGQFIATLGMTTKDRHWDRNVISACRRAGMTI
ncbi:HicA-like toxin [Gordonia phage Buggaboo]|nr:HicA-like toxin [Gordonia phage Buggaboo]AYD83199.1 HicA-like toxin [Gordonia phage Buggaboo]